MCPRPVFDSSFLRDRYQPHWVWAVVLVLVPLCLILTAFLGLSIGSPVPFDVAAIAPRLALGISTGGMAVAAVRARRIPLLIATTGLVMTVAAFLLLVWIA